MTVQKQINEIAKVVNMVQAHVRTEYPRAFTGSTINAKEVKTYIEKNIRDQKLRIEGLTGRQLIERVYQEMVGYSILTPYFDDDDVEEINVNSWDMITISYRNGRFITLKESFLSPSDARDIIIRLLEAESEMLMDQKNPIVLGHLKKNIRIQSSIHPILDESCGAQASIRIVNPRNLTKRDFIRYNTLTEEMFDFLSICFSHEVSICIGGSTDAGKTTLMSAILRAFPKNKRLITIEEKTREFDLIHRDENGLIDNEVVQWKTHGDYTTRHLLENALTGNPKGLCISEMRSGEAYFAQEAARTGHSVITTTHTNSCRATYGRLVSLCKMASDLDNETLLNFVTEAFPILVYTKKMEDNSRKVMEITECIKHDDFSFEIKTLYEYEIEMNDFDENNNPLIIGKFVKRNNISDALKRRFLMNGVPSRSIDALLREDVS